jgi:ketosteroid isomerase-like protein
MNRRQILAAAAASAVPYNVSANDEIAELSAMSTRGYAALMKGDGMGFAKAMKHTEDFTLMQPFGKVVHGLDTSPEHLKRLGSFFKNGNFRQEIIQSISSGDIAVLVTIEHQSVEVGGLAKQEWPLRVTLVFRRENGEWQLAHRHADPLVNGISIEQAAALARGESAIKEEM